MFKCLVKEDGTPYKREHIEFLLAEMPAGFTTDISQCIYEVSGIPTDKGTSEEIQRFLEGMS